MKKIFLLALSSSLLLACGSGNKSKEAQADGGSGETQKTALHYKGEKHLANIKQLTFGGDNAEVTGE